jgi:hypothetical protein
MLAGFCICSLFTLRTILIGRRHQVRYWLSSGTHRDRVQRNWPPRLGQHNDASKILLSGISLISLLILPISTAILIAIMDPIIGPIPVDFLPLLYVFIVLLGVPTVILLLMDWLRKWMIAARPADCWGTDPLPDPKPSKAPPAHPDDVWMQS